MEKRQFLALFIAVTLLFLLLTGCAGITRIDNFFENKEYLDHSKIIDFALFFIIFFALTYTGLSRVWGEGFGKPGDAKGPIVGISLALGITLAFAIISQTRFSITTMFPIAKAMLFLLIWFVIWGLFIASKIFGEHWGGKAIAAILALIACYLIFSIATFFICEMESNQDDPACESGFFSGGAQLLQKLIRSLTPDPSPDPTPGPTPGPTPTPECRAISDCPANHNCIGGKCEELLEPAPPCTTTADCFAGQICISGSCFVRNCDSSSDCSDGKTCKDGQCLDRECNSISDCPANNNCIDGNCEELLQPRPTCTTTADCFAGQICISGTCFVKECDSSSDCSGGKTCNNGQCITPECTSNSDCGTNEACTNGACVAIECSSNSDCGTNEICRNNECITPTICTGLPGSCPDGQVCRNNACVPSPSSCRSYADCGTGMECRAGVCVASTSCNMDSDCLLERVCRDNRCVEPYDAPNDPQSGNQDQEGSGEEENEEGGGIPWWVWIIIGVIVLILLGLLGVSVVATGFVGHRVGYHQWKKWKHGEDLSIMDDRILELIVKAMEMLEALNNDIGNREHTNDEKSLWKRAMQSKSPRLRKSIEKYLGGAGYDNITYAPNLNPPTAGGPSRKKFLDRVESCAHTIRETHSLLNNRLLNFFWPKLKRIKKIEDRLMKTAVSPIVHFDKKVTFMYKAPPRTTNITEVKVNYQKPDGSVKTETLFNVNPNINVWKFKTSDPLVDGAYKYKYLVTQGGVVTQLKDSLNNMSPPGTTQWSLLTVKDPERDPAGPRP
ncbi:hypothetical protein HQ545_02720 [Candidatus Woesearchaeota archaeon]|nr:hypothetical protein [Candidatus Woesearchaeota archaeon]